MRIALMTALSIFTVACGGSIPPPNDEWSAAQADVGRAEAAAHPACPDAKLHLQLAQEDLQKAKALIDQDNKRAASLVAVARVEAQLALSLAKGNTAQAQAHTGPGRPRKAKGTEDPE